MAQLVANLSQTIKHGAEGLAVHLEGDALYAGDLPAASWNALNLQLHEAGRDGHASKAVGRGLDVDAPIDTSKPGDRKLQAKILVAVAGKQSGKALYSQFEVQFIETVVLKPWL